MPSHTKEEIVEFISKHPSLIGLFPKMIMQYILKKANSNDPEVIANTIKHLKFTVLENMDFKNAQVTAGGVLTSEVDENLASKFNNNLYIIGELLDVDGICGGYNLHFAFASAYKVALDIINKGGVKDE
jgi:predicted flavoprotein YhiN